MRYIYSLELRFEKSSDKTIYEGDSYYNSRIVDRILITHGQIVVSFTREKRINVEEYLYTPVNPVRIQLYKAACFYLAVVGKLPPVKEVSLRIGDKQIQLDKDRLTRFWENCHIEYTLEPEQITKCFGKNGKTCYIALTYFLKAQLVAFPQDSFRAAWSALNALYTGLDENANEAVKLQALSKYLSKQPPKLTHTYVNSLTEGFWDKLEWYNYIQNRGLDRAAEDVFKTDYYHDRIIYSHLGSSIITMYEQQERKKLGNKAEKLRRVYEQNLAIKYEDINQQVRFLVVRYCYMLRNRSFHANKPYPVFGLFDESADTAQKAVTNILLNVIRDTIGELS